MNLELNDIWKTYSNQRTPAIQGISIKILSGRITALAGHSGSGKTTLLRPIAGFERPDRGTISRNGHRISGQGAFLAPQKRSVAMIFRDLALFPHLSAERNVAFGANKGNRKIRTFRSRELLQFGKATDLYLKPINHAVARFFGPVNKIHVAAIPSGSFGETRNELLVRPEHCAISRRNGGHEPEVTQTQRIPGTVNRCRFMGEYWKVEVVPNRKEPACSETLLAYSSNPQEIGDDVWVSILSPLSSAFSGNRRWRTQGARHHMDLPVFLLP